MCACGVSERWGTKSVDTKKELTRELFLKRERVSRIQRERAKGRVEGERRARREIERERERCELSDGTPLEKKGRRERRKTNLLEPVKAVLLHQMVDLFLRAVERVHGRGDDAGVDGALGLEVDVDLEHGALDNVGVEQVLGHGLALGRVGNPPVFLDVEEEEQVFDGELAHEELFEPLEPLLVPEQ